MSGGSGSVAGLMREHRLVGLIDQQLGRDEYKCLIEHSRVRSLPDMLRRHGLLQVVAFLKSKAKGDTSGADTSDRDDPHATGERALLDLLAMALQEDLRPAAKTVGDEIPSLGVTALATLGEKHPADYLYLNESAIYAATWIQRLAAARETLREQEGD